MRLKFKILLFIGFIWLWTGIVTNLAPTTMWRNLSPYVWLFQPIEATYTPGGGTGIKSIQHVGCTALPSPQTVTFNTVNLGSSVLSRVGAGMTVQSGTPGQGATFTVFTASNSASCQSSVNGPQSNFDVIEYIPGALAHATAYNVQVSIGTGPNVSADVAHGYSVNTNKALAFLQGCVLNNGQDDGSATTFSVIHISATTLRVYKGPTANGYTCAVGMVEFR